MKRFFSLFTLCLALFFALFALGCSSGGGGGKDECPVTNLDIAVCDPDTGGPFSENIDNEFFPLAPDSMWVLEGEDDGEIIRLELTVPDAADPDATEVVAGVTTRVMVETEFENGVLIEISRNFFAQAPDGTVCYFGEDVEIFRNGVVVSNEGEWRAGENGNLPGIFMPADPQVGDVFSQEVAPGVAEDIAEVIALGEEIDVPAGIFNDTLTARDCNPLEDAESDRKVYVRGIGLAIDEEAELISF